MTIDAAISQLEATKEAAWEEGFTQLLKYVKEHGDALVPASYKDPDGYKLGGWVNSQCRRGNRGKLSPERKARLESVEGWVWDQLEATKEAAWKEGFVSLLKYVDEHGDTPPDSYKEPDGYKLGGWVGGQRSKGNRGKLTSERKARLESVEGWVWDQLEATKEAAWEESFAALRKYVEKHGDVLVPSSYKEPDGYKLGRWVVKQRSNNKSGTLLPERKTRLESVEGWVWSPERQSPERPDFTAAWEEGFTQLLKYVKEHGDALVPASYKDPGGYRLAAWVGKQRGKGKRGKLSPERKQRFESVEGWVWDVAEADWEEGFERLLKYVEEHGDTLMPAKYKEPDGYRLGGWVKKQRSVYKRGKLLPERKTRLESVEGWAWELTVTGQLPGESWEEGFKRLQRYVEEHKTIPKQSYREPDGYRLGRWVTKQRSKGNRGKLTPERKARLESVEGWVWDASFLKSSKNR